MRYCYQKVAWQARLPQNSFGDFKYCEPQTILARKQSSQEIVKTAQGKELLGKNVYYVFVDQQHDIAEMDKLDGELVMSRREMRNLTGTLLYVKLVTV